MKEITQEIGLALCGKRGSWLSGMFTTRADCVCTCFYAALKRIYVARVWVLALLLNEVRSTGQGLEIDTQDGWHCTQPLVDRNYTSVSRVFIYKNNKEILKREDNRRIEDLLATIVRGADIRPAEAKKQETIEHRYLVLATSTCDRLVSCCISRERSFHFNEPVTCWRRRRLGIDINGRRGAAEAQRTVSQEKATTDRALGVSVCLNKQRWLASTRGAQSCENLEQTGNAAVERKKLTVREPVTVV